MNGKLLSSALTCALVLFTAPAGAATIDLSSWTKESTAALSGQPDASWTVAPGGASATIGNNGQPTFFFGGDDVLGKKISATVRTVDADDDFFGFVLGFNAGEATSGAADYLLIDWKKSTQNHNFNAPSTTPGGNATIGLAVSRITGAPTADEFWQHTNYASHTGGAVTELARASTLGSTGWGKDISYAFTFDFGPNNLVISVNGTEQFNITGAFTDGKFGFYNFSQPRTTYSGVTVENGSFQTAPVPEPASWAMMIGGFGLVGGTLRRRSSNVRFAM